MALIRPIGKRGRRGKGGRRRKGGGRVRFPKAIGLPTAEEPA